MEIELQTNKSDTINQSINNDIVLQQDTEQIKLKRPPKSTTLSAMCKILKVSIGTGVLALSQSFSKCGIFGGIIILIFCLIIQYYSWLVFVKAIEEKTRLAVQDKLQHQNSSMQNAPDKDEGGFDLDKYQESMIQIQQLQEEQEQLDQIFIQKEQKIPGPTTRKITVKEIIEEQEKQEQYKKDRKKKEKELEKKIQEIKNIIQQMEMRQNYKAFSIYDLIRAQFKDDKYGLICLQITTLTALYGSDVSYLIFFKQALIDCNSDFGQSWVLVLEGIVLVSFIFIFSFYKRLESLRLYVVVGSYLQLVILYFVVSLCLYQIKLNLSKPAANPIYNTYTTEGDITYQVGVKFAGLPQFFGVALFSYDFNALFTEIRQEMKLTYKFPRILFISMSIECILYIFIGTIGYVAYGQYNSDIITTNVNTTINGLQGSYQIFYLILMLLYSIGLIVTVLLSNVVAFKIINEMIFGDNEYRQKPAVVIRVLIRLSFIIPVVVLNKFTAMFFYQFTIVISLLGCITSVILGFILPYIMYLKFLKETSKFSVHFCNTLVLILGITGGLLGLIFIAL